MIIGITGGSGCGKTTLLEVISSCGGLVLDCDRIYHELLRTDKELIGRIESRFPDVVEQGILNRKKLGNLVFSDEKALNDLNQITHTYVKKAVMLALKENPPLAAIDAIGLFEGGLAKLCDVTVAVIAPEEQRVSRLMKRDHIPADYAKKRILAQRPQKEFAEICDYTLENNGDIELFRNSCLAFLRQLDII